jgi:hypothetical protein
MADAPFLVSCGLANHHRKGVQVSLFASVRRKSYLLRDVDPDASEYPPSRHMACLVTLLNVHLLK